MSGLNTEFLITMTNTFDLPSSRAITVTGGRALSGTQLASPRSAFYEQVESAVGRFTGAAGRDCLLRAMCEVAATPHHEEVWTESISVCTALLYRVCWGMPSTLY